MVMADPIQPVPGTLGNTDGADGGKLTCTKVPDPTDEQVSGRMWRQHIIRAPARARGTRTPAIRTRIPRASLLNRYLVPSHAPRDHPTQVEELMGRYTDALTRLFDQYKAQAGYPDAVLEIK